MTLTWSKRSRSEEEQYGGIHASTEIVDDNRVVLSWLLTDEGIVYSRGCQQTCGKCTHLDISRQANRGLVWILTDKLKVFTWMLADKCTHVYTGRQGVCTHVDTVRRGGGGGGGGGGLN